MIWNGLTLRLAADCEPDEDVIEAPEEVAEESDARELIENHGPIPGLVLEGPIVDGFDDRNVEIKDAALLGAWIERRLSADEWETLHREHEEDAQDAADDAGETLMRDRARGVA